MGCWKNAQIVSQIGVFINFSIIIIAILLFGVLNFKVYVSATGIVSNYVFFFQVKIILFCFLYFCGQWKA